VHFLHIGKTGGMAIRHALKPYRETARYKIKRHGHRQTLQDIPQGEGVIFIADCAEASLEIIIHGLLRSRRHSADLTPRTASPRPCPRTTRKRGTEPGGR
jgi:hypothetical protein